MSTNVPRYSLGDREFFCTAVNRNDPEQAGRVQVRIIGYQDNKATIPDQQLPWGRQMAPSNQPQKGGIGTSLNGPMVGTIFRASYMDADRQMIGLHSTLTASGKDNGKGGLDTSKRNHDMPPHFRDDKTGGGDKRWVTTDPDNAEGEHKESLTEFAVKGAKSPDGKTQAKDSQGFTLGNHMYDA